MYRYMNIYVFLYVYNHTITTETLRRQQINMGTVSHVYPLLAGWPPSRIYIYIYMHVHMYMYTHIPMHMYITMTRASVWSY